MAATKSDLVSFLKTLVPPGIGTLDRLKVVYRPLICPLDELLNLVKPGASVFDFGCGNGSFLALAARFCGPSRLGGIEISDKLVSNARRVLANASSVPADIRVFNGSDVPGFLTSYDYVFMTDVFHHIPPAIQRSVLTQVYERMQPGALFVMKDIDASSPFHYFNKLHDLVAAGEIGKEISMSNMERMLTDIGFTVESRSYVRLFWYPHFTLVCKK